MRLDTVAVGRCAACCLVNLALSLVLMNPSAQASGIRYKPPAPIASSSRVLRRVQHAHGWLLWSWTQMLVEAKLLHGLNLFCICVPVGSAAAAFPLSSCTACAYAKSPFQSLLTCCTSADQLSCGRWHREWKTEHTRQISLWWLI